MLHCKTLLKAHQAPAAPVIIAAEYAMGFTPSAQRNNAPEIAPEVKEFKSSCLPLQWSSKASTML